MAFGQAARSPITTLGLGQPYGALLTPNRGMGGIGVSTPRYWELSSRYMNIQNPALLTNNRLTVFELGFLAESRTVKRDTISENNQDGNLSYLAIAFPVRPSDPLKPHRWTTAFSLNPFTNLNYKLQYQEPIQGVENETTVTEQGSGGLSEFSWSNGYRITNNLSVGIKSAYLFGAVDRDYRNIVNNTGVVPYLIAVNEKTHYSNFRFTGGVSYQQDSVFSSDYFLGAGFVYSFGSDLRAKRTTVFERRNLFDPISSDTLETNNGFTYLPPSYTFGLSLAKRLKWMIGAEFTYQDWSQYRNISNENEGLRDSWILAAGGEFTPNAESIGSYLETITYRAGFKYEKTPFLANSNEIREIGINFGVSLPISGSSLDLAVEAGRRGSATKNTLFEDYFKIYFGVSFNDSWFNRRRFD